MLGYYLGLSPVKTCEPGLALLDVGSEPEQGVLGGHQLAPGLVELLLLALHEPAIGRDGLVDPGGGLLQLQVHLAGEGVFEMGAELVDPPLEIALCLPPLPGNDVEPSDGQGGGQEDAGDVGRRAGDHA